MDRLNTDRSESIAGFRFSWHIPIAALEAIIKLDERNVPPLQDAEWQQEKKGE